MKTSINVGGEASGKGKFDDVVAYVVEAEKLGIDQVWSAEAWGMDAVAPLAFVAGRTNRLTYGAGVMQVGARRPSMTAMTAMSMAAITGNRFILGLGVSGPQVVEGLLGEPFAKPVERLRETIDIVRLAFAGEKLVYDGAHYRLPRPGGEGKALRLAQPANPAIPIWIGALGPKALELTGELADGWCATSFVPEAADVYFAPIRRGAARAGRSLDRFEARVDVVAGIGEDVERMLAKRKAALAFQLGGMGSPKTNFYNAAFRRLGYADDAAAVQSLWVEGKRDEAAARVPDEMAIRTSLLGTEAMVRERLRAFRGSGITVLGLSVMADGTMKKLDVLGRLVELVREECVD